MVGAPGRDWVHREKSEEKAASRWRVVWEGCSEEWDGKKLGQLGLEDRKRGTPREDKGWGHAGGCSFPSGIVRRPETGEGGRQRPPFEEVVPLCAPDQCPGESGPVQGWAGQGVQLGVPETLPCELS